MISCFVIVYPSAIPSIDCKGYPVISLLSNTVRIVDCRLDEFNTNATKFNDDAPEIIYWLGITEYYYSTNSTSITLLFES